MSNAILSPEQLESIIHSVINDEKEKAWLEKTTSAILSSSSYQRTLYLAFSGVHRFIAPQNINENTMIPGFSEVHQLIRAYLLLLTARHHPDEVKKHVERLLDTADFKEQTVIYRLLYYFPQPETYHHLATEGIRTNITDVFDSIALENPFPAAFLSTEAFNQMVLKALFTNRPIWKILNIDSRLNPELARMAVEFARERRSAGRSISPELWRLTGPYIDKTTFEDHVTTFENGDEDEKAAILLSCHQSNDPKAQAFYEKHKSGLKEISNFNEIGKKVAP